MVITRLNQSEIFVFGSNEAGRHGAGAAKWGAKYGQGEGLQGLTYAIPTKDHNIRTLPLEKIDIYVARFFSFALAHSGLTFLVTPIGCGLAGYKPEDIAPLFLKHSPSLIPNIRMPEEFLA